MRTRDYDTEESAAARRVVLTTDVSQRILDQLANNVPSAKVLKSVALTKTQPWRCRTKPIKDLIPEEFVWLPGAGEGGGTGAAGADGDHGGESAGEVSGGGVRTGRRVGRGGGRGRGWRG